MTSPLIDWSDGAWSQNGRDEDAPSILFCADWAPTRALEKPIVERPGSLYGKAVRAELERSVLRIVNVETTLQRNPGVLRPVVKEGPPFGSPARAVEDLLSAGFDVGLLANNHTGDFGPEGIVETRALLEEAGLRTTGTGTDQDDAYEALVVTVGGRSVAIVNFHEGEEGAHTGRNPALAGWDLERVRAEVAKQKTAGRLVIAVPHADREFFPVPAPYGHAAYRSLIDAGADAVIGHHPHVPRGIEIYRDAPIIYSQGNFLFWSGQPGLFRRLGYMVRLYVGTDGVAGFRLLPYRIRPDGLVLLEGRERQWLFAQLAAVSGEALQPDSVRAYWRAAMDTFSRDEWLRDATGMEFTFLQMQAGEPLGIARLRTRLCCPAHYHFMTEGITRVIDGTHGNSPPELVDRVRQWTGPSEPEIPA
ncbi:MAG: CapA family protein [Opitutales bacterium]|nr:CapA family protein [Opitutales bacterium]